MLRGHPTRDPSARTSRQAKPSETRSELLCVRGRGRRSTTGGRKLGGAFAVRVAGSAPFSLWSASAVARIAKPNARGTAWLACAPAELIESERSLGGGRSGNRLHDRRGRVRRFGQRWFLRAKRFHRGLRCLLSFGCARFLGPPQDQLDDGERENRTDDDEDSNRRALHVGDSGRTVDLLVLLQRSWPKKVACAIGVHELRAGQGRHATVAGLL